MTVFKNSKGMIIQSVASAALIIAKRRYARKPGVRKGSATIARNRVSVREIYEQMGDYYFKRSYRMTYSSFKKLFGILKEAIIEAIWKKAVKKGSKGGKKRYIHNGPIAHDVRLACALRYFAGGDPVDIGVIYAIGRADVMFSVWYIISAINNTKYLDIKFPTTLEEQQEIANGFRAVSAADFQCCVGAIDGILIWIHRPSEAQCEHLKVSSGKFFCGRKHKFGLNCQAVCDSRGKFLDASIIFPGSTSDLLAFDGSNLFHLLEKGLLHKDFCLFGDNAYINSLFMATPYPAVTGGSKDAYNFYHSQVRIRIEMAFGMITSRWSILRKAIPMNITVKKTIAMVMALLKLHNFCIDEADTAIAKPTATDELNVFLDGGISLEPLRRNGEADVESDVPYELLGGGEHREDISRTTVRGRERAAMAGETLPRERLHEQVMEKNLRRPVPTARRH